MLGLLALTGCSGASNGDGAGGAGGSGGAGVDSGPPPPTFTELTQDVLRSGCASPLCHDHSSRQGNLALNGPDLNAIATEYLIDVPAAGEACGGIGFTRVIPGDPDGSLLYTKLIDPPCGDPMPPAGPLPDEDIELIRLWIEAGAPLE